MFALTLIFAIATQHPITECRSGWVPTISIRADQYAWTSDQYYTKPYKKGGPFLSWGQEVDWYASLLWCSFDGNTLNTAVVTPTRFYFYFVQSSSQGL